MAQGILKNAMPVRVTVSLPAPLVRLFPGSCEKVELEADCIHSLLGELDRRWPGMADRLSDSSPAIRKHINIFVEGRRARLDTPLKPDMQVTILTAMSGG
ncbi:MAG: MoaD/ThiS family protein [Hyphomicrobiales bacterium]|nr:MoaD/ThiS family protein [Hyphomicrobiales bacterium]